MMYKQKERKINPVNVPLPGGVNLGGRVNSEGRLSKGETWSQIGVDLEPWRHEGTVVPWGSQLTPEWLVSIWIDGGFLLEAEKQLFVDILFDYEGMITFDDSKMGMLKLEIELPIIIHTVPYTP